MAITYPLSLPSPAKISRYAMFGLHATAILRSPWTFATQVQQHQGEMWGVEVTVALVARANAAAWKAFLAKCRGPYGTFLMGDPYATAPRGVATGSPKVSGSVASRSTTITTKGWTTGVTGILKEDDVIQIGSRLYQVLLDVNSDGSGNCTLDVFPQVREALTDNTTIVTTGPKGLWRLDKAEVPLYELDVEKLYTVSFTAVEALEGVARNLTAGFLAAAAGGSCRPIVLLEAAFDGSTLRLWNGHQDLAWNAQTWLGNGWFSGVEGGDETTQVEAVDMTVVLSGVPAALISLVLNDQKQGATGSLYVGFLDAAGAVVADPYLWWQGGYSHAEFDESPDEPTVRLFYDSPLVEMDRPREGRWTHDCQQKWFPGDLGFQYVVQAANWHGQWGGEKKKLTGGDRRQPKKPKGSPPKRRR